MKKSYSSWSVWETDYEVFVNRLSRKLPKVQISYFVLIQLSHLWCHSKSVIIWKCDFTEVCFLFFHDYLRNAKHDFFYSNFIHYYFQNICHFNLKFFSRKIRWWDGVFSRVKLPSKVQFSVSPLYIYFFLLKIATSMFLILTLMLFLNHPP